MILTDGRRVVWRGHAGSQDISETLARTFVWHKLKEHGFAQDERDPCLFVNTDLDICIGVHVYDMLAVGPSELTKNCCRNSRKT